MSTLLLENGDDLLLEDGSFLLMEDGATPVDPVAPVAPVAPSSSSAAPVPATRDLIAMLPGSVAVVFPVTHRHGYAGYCTYRRFTASSTTLSVAVSVAANADEATFLQAVEEQSTGVNPYGSLRVPSSFLVSARRVDAQDSGFSSSDSPGSLATISGGPDDGLTIYENSAEAVSLSQRIALDTYGWMVAGSDDLLPGTVTYPLDAHDDTLLFEYSSSGASLRVCPVPHGSTQPAEAMHASAFNCERETLQYYSQRPYVRQGDQTWRYVGRPVYADGTVGPVCFEGVDDLLSSCDDLCNDDSSGG